jgi:UDP-glucose 4-epimerase
MNVIEAIIASGIRRLVFSSSASVYGDAVTEPMQEDHPFNCQEFYGASKVCGEMLIRAMYQRERKKGSGFEYAGLRFMNVYGPRQDDKGAYVGVVTSMLNVLDANDQPVIHGDGSQSYDFIDVRDCARANILAMESNISNQFFNIGTGIKTSVSELARLLLELTGSDREVRYVAADRPFVRNRVGCVAKARTELGFLARTNLKDGLRNLITWRRTNGEKGRG